MIWPLKYFLIILSNIYTGAIRFARDLFCIKYVTLSIKCNCHLTLESPLKETVLISTKLLCGKYVKCLVMNWALIQENLFSGFVNNKSTDQPAHPRKLISAFVIRFLESIISKLATSEISIF